MMQHRAPSSLTPSTWLVALSATLTLVSGCGDHPPRSECEAFAEHYIELAVGQYEEPADQAVARETAEGAKALFVNHCTDAGSKTAVACAMEAATIEAYRECFPKKPEEPEDDKAEKTTKPRSSATPPAKTRPARDKAASDTKSSAEAPATPTPKSATPADKPADTPADTPDKPADNPAESKASAPAGEAAATPTPPT